MGGGQILGGDGRRCKGNCARDCPNGHCWTIKRKDQIADYPDTPCLTGDRICCCDNPLPSVPETKDAMGRTQYCSNVINVNHPVIPQDAEFHWSAECQSYTQHDFTIDGAIEYCYSIDDWASHCMTLVSIKKGTQYASVLMQLGGSYDSDTVVSCKVFPKKWDQVDGVSLTAAGDVIVDREWDEEKNDWGEARKGWTNEENPSFVSQAFAPSADASALAGYNHKSKSGNGYDDQHTCENTMMGLKKWVIAYVRNYPTFSPDSRNCQKFSVGLYNAITRQSK
eukprot:gnl/TRDRNA2_/TRDRNA2_35636_c0_seq2.p1 gnl/TRDRNA2_/TRDRNA2_35636_c0~~gnl/TRDRNA2_/TRDRNA2_35636_c0_seq2.p1  ORF type:complete len:308 (+),score=22.95 gnl/TRDRNA2_/TRDRNA2_35636_c0_seq2:84-926(+)